MPRLLYIMSIILFLLSPIANSETIYVIAHKGSFINIQKNKDLANFYLLKKVNNNNGDNIIPINLPTNSPLRDKFSRVVFGRSPEALSEYWDRMSFRGVRPPVVQNSEQAVMLFVSRVKGAIGYVSKKPENNPNIVVLSEFSL
jgi:hypothetical protein